MAQPTRRANEDSGCKQAGESRQDIRGIIETEGGDVNMGRLFYTEPLVDLWLGDARDVLGSLPAESVHCVVTSPP